MPMLMSPATLRKAAQAGDRYTCAIELRQSTCRTLGQAIRLIYPGSQKVPFKAFDTLADAWAALMRARSSGVVTSEEIKASLQHHRT